MNVEQALKLSKEVSPQHSIEILRGLTVRRTNNGLAVLRVHYTADPDRDPAINPEWFKAERRKYTSQSQWQKEQEIMHDAGGGERVFADILTEYANKIIITDPTWKPGRNWRIVAGMDHGTANPTAALIGYMDQGGVMYLAGEYYAVRHSAIDNSANLKTLPGFMESEDVLCDPTMFDKLNQQRDGSFQAVADMYHDQGIENLRPYIGNRSDVAFTEKLLGHWANLDEREPTVRIVCRMPVPERPMYGVHTRDCPTLIWELMRARREQLSSQQLLTRNTSERIVDRDNHLRDCLKFLVNSMPEAAEFTIDERVAEHTKPWREVGDYTNALIQAKIMREKLEEDEEPAQIGTSRMNRIGGNRSGVTRFGSRRRR